MSRTRRWGLIVLLPFLLSISAVAAVPVAAANGDNLRTISADTSGTTCPNIGTGLAFDGTNLLLSCWTDNKIVLINPANGAQVGIHTISLGGASGFGALAWDNGRHKLWACKNAGSEVGLIDLTTDTYTTAFTSRGCTDGLAYDFSDDTIWSSADAAPTTEHFTTTGTLIMQFSNSGKIGSCGNSGIAVGGPSLYLANNGCSQIYTVAKDFSTSSLFATFPARLEDLECDNVTFAPSGAIWSKDAYDNTLNAWEIPAGSCLFGGGGGNISLTPPAATNPAGTDHTVTAHVTDATGAPLSGQLVTFTVTGQNAGATGTCVPADCKSDASGNVTFTYHDTNGAGDDTIAASFTDSAGHLQSATATKHWEAPTDPLITASGVAIAATEGTSFNGTVATFTDPDLSAIASEYSATIDWGDGSLPSAGTVSGSAGSFTVSGSHIYAEEGGPFDVTVVITDVDNAANTATVVSRATVADAALTSACATPAFTAQAFAGSTATFTDASSTGTLSDFSATIDWGDATSSAGTIVGGPGNAPYTVSGTHTYTSTGPFTVTTTINDVGGSTTTATCNSVVFAFAPGGGSFVIGDKESATGTSVMFWGAQWWKNNPVSSGTTVAAFKGFAEKPVSPTCGTTWSTDPGNSTPPPAGPLPAYMGVIVTSTYSKSGSTISGDILHIVIVKTDPGYQPNPGHAGTGTVVGQVC